MASSLVRPPRRAKSVLMTAASRSTRARGSWGASKVLILRCFGLSRIFRTLGREVRV